MSCARNNKYDGISWNVDVVKVSSPNENVLAVNVLVGLATIFATGPGETMATVVAY